MTILPTILDRHIRRKRSKGIAMDQFRCLYRWDEAVAGLVILTNSDRSNDPFGECGRGGTEYGLADPQWIGMTPAT